MPYYLIDTHQGRLAIWRRRNQFFTFCTDEVFWMHVVLPSSDIYHLQKWSFFMIEIYKVVVSKYCPSHKSLNKPYVRQNTLKVCIKPYIVFWKATLNSLFPLLDIIDILNIYRLYSSDLKIRFWVYRKVSRIYDSVNAELVII